MKKSLLISPFVTLILISIICKAQIPNNGFENWVNVPFQYQAPTGWNTNNSQFDGFNLVHKTSDAHQGSFAMSVLNFYSNVYQARVGGYATIKFPYMLRPLSLNGFYQSYLQPGDTATIEVIFTNGNTVIGSGINYFTTNNNVYTSFSIPINFTSNAMPDSAYISIANGKPGLNFQAPIPDDSLLVDALTFVLSSGENELDNSNSPSVFPNPVSNIINFEMPFKNNATSIDITNDVGLSVMKIENRNCTSIQTINVTALTPGVYVLNIATQNENKTIRFIKR